MDNTNQMEQQIEMNNLSPNGMPYPYPQQDLKTMDMAAEVSEVEASPNPVHIPVDNKLTDIDLNGDNPSKDDDAEPSKEEHILFGDSSHQYLIYFGHPKGHPSKSFNGLILGIVSLIIEYTLLSFMVDEGQKLVREDLVPVMVPYGVDCNQKESYTALQCDVDSANPITLILAPALLAIFLMSDTVVALKGVFVSKGFVSKLGAISLFAVSCFACYVGGLFAFQGVYSGSTYDAIVNCVGVLFICDIDEKAYATFKAVEDVVRIPKCEETKCCKSRCCKPSHKVKYCMVFCCVVFLIGASLPAIFTETGAYDNWEESGNWPTYPNYNFDEEYYPSSSGSYSGSSPVPLPTPQPVASYPTAPTWPTFSWENGN